MVIVPKVKLNFVFLNIEFMMSAATLEYTLYISVASTCKFRWWILKDLSLSSSSSNVGCVALQTGLKAYSWSLLILLLTVLLWHIKYQGTVTKLCCYEHFHNRSKFLL